MQQLFSAFGVNWGLLIAQAVNFSIVLFALWHFLYKPVMSMLKKRQELVAKGVADAEQAGEMLANADGEVLKRVQAADEQAESIVIAARESAVAEKSRLMKDAEARAITITKDAEARANEIAERARKESEREVARLAIIAAEKILKKS